MKHKFILSLLFLTLFFTACENEDWRLPVPQNCVEVKLVAELCGQAVIQVVSEQHFSLGEGSWTDWDGNVHRNVFSTNLHCEDMERIPRDGATFLIKIVDEEEWGPQNCAVCLALFADRPERFHYMRMIDNCGESF